MKKLLLIIILSIFSCGYEKTENDKYPDLPLFPDIINSNFEIIKFPYRSYKYLGMVNGNLYTIGAIDYNEMYGGKRHIIIYDENLNILNKIPIENGIINVDIAKNGDFYVHTENSKDVKKFTFPKFESTLIKKHPLSWASLNSHKNEEILNLKESDSTFDSNRYMVNILNKKLDSINKIKESCYSKLKSSTLLKFDNEEVWFDDYKMDFKSFKNCNSFISNNKKTENLKLKIFDNAKLGNQSSGNHFAFSFYQYGIEYFNLVKGQDTLKFKYNSRYLNGKSIQEYKGFNADQVILITEWEHKMYLIK